MHFSSLLYFGKYGNKFKYINADNGIVLYNVAKTYSYNTPYEYIIKNESLPESFYNNKFKGFNYSTFKNENDLFSFYCNRIKLKSIINLFINIQQISPDYMGLDDINNTDKYQKIAGPYIANKIKNNITKFISSVIKKILVKTLGLVAYYILDIFETNPKIQMIIKALNHMMNRKLKL